MLIVSVFLKIKQSLPQDQPVFLKTKQSLPRTSVLLLCWLILADGAKGQWEEAHCHEIDDGAKGQWTARVAMCVDFPNRLAQVL